MDKWTVMYHKTMDLKGTHYPSWIDMVDALHEAGYCVMEWDEGDNGLGEYADDDFVQVCPDTDDELYDMDFSLGLAHRGNGEYWVVEVSYLGG